MTDFNVAIVGASGAVGQELVRLLGLRNFPIKKLTLLASKRSAGKTIKSDFGELTIEEFSVDHFQDKDFVFFATSGDHAKEFAPRAVEAGAVVIDNSSAFRLDEQVPLVVPEVNAKAAFTHQGIIANPNCSTIQMVVALNPIHQYSRLTRIVVSTYQAVSGAGQDAMDELKQQLQDSVAGNDIQVEQFTKQIAFNVIPHIDVFQDNGYTKEEMKMVKETWKIMDDYDIKIAANCVRVPVLRAHSEAINIETESYVGEAKAKQLLQQAKDIVVVDERANGGYPTPLEVSEKMETYVGRIREDISCEKGLALWCVADQLWKGAALNAVQIAELLARGE